MYTRQMHVFPVHASVLGLQPVGFLCTHLAIVQDIQCGKEAMVLPHFTEKHRTSYKVAILPLDMWKK